MYLAQITFHFTNKLKRTDIETLADIYLDRVAGAGQIGKDVFLNWVNGELIAHVEVSRPDSLEEKHHTEWGREARNNIQDKTGLNPSVTILDDNIPKRFARWKNSPFLVLSADYWDDDHPVRRGSDGYPFPAYQLPLDQGEMHNLHCWRNHCQCQMGVWFRSEALEMAAYKQLADPMSNLSGESMEHCKAIEEATNIPTFYYLFRYWGRKDSEARRRCPLCGKVWKLEKPFNSKKNGWRIDFKCDTCRIVSTLAAEYDDERHARIGEYRKKIKLIET